MSEVDPNVQTEEGLTALIMTVRGSKTECETQIIRALVEDPRTRIDLQDLNGRSACAWAAFSGCKTLGSLGDKRYVDRKISTFDAEVVRVLIKGGADVSLPDVSGHTPLDYARCARDYAASILLSWQTLMTRLLDNDSNKGQVDVTALELDCWADIVIKFEPEKVPEYTAAVSKLESERLPALDEVVSMLEAAGAQARMRFEYEDLMPDEWLKNAPHCLGDAGLSEAQRIAGFKPVVAF